MPDRRLNDERLVARLLGKHSGLTVVQVKSILRALATNVVAGTEHNMHV